MKILRRLVMAITSLIASLVVWVVVVLGTVAITVGAGTAISIPFVVTNTLGQGANLATTEMEFPGALVAVVLLAALIFVVSLRLDRARERTARQQSAADTQSAATA